MQAGGRFQLRRGAARSRAGVFRLRRRHAPPAGRPGLPARRRRAARASCMPIMEDEHGTYIMNSKDLRAVEHVERLVEDRRRLAQDRGPHQEPVLRGAHRAGLPPRHRRRRGRAGRSTRADHRAGRPGQPRLHRRLPGAPPGAGLPELRDRQLRSAPQPVRRRGAQSSKDGWAEVETKNRFAVGDTLEIIHPAGNRTVQLTQMKNLEGEPISVAPGSPLRVWIPLDGPVDGALIARLMVEQPVSA